MTELRTAEQARDWLKSRGVSAVEFAATNQFPIHTVYKVLSGKVHGDRGVSHHVAVALGIKAGETSPVA